MDDGRDHQDELTLAPATVVRTPRRRALWGVLAAVGVAAGALVVVSANDDGTTRPGLPVALGLGAQPRAANGAEDTSMPAWITYVPGDDLPALGGEAPAYRLPGPVSEDQVRALADALDLDGTLVHENSVWRATGDAGTLEVYEGGGATWWFTSVGGGGVAGGSGGSTGSGCAETTDDVVTECTVTTLADPPDCGAADGEGCFPTEEPTCDGPTEGCVVTPEDPCAVHADGYDPCADRDCATANDVTCPDDTADPPAPAADLPSADEARAIALDLLAATGVDVDDASVTVDGPFDTWMVNVEPRLDGVPSGLVAAVAVGPEGEITMASGHLARPERLGDYPLLDTRAAIDRANAQVGAVERGEPDIATDTGGSTGDDPGDTVVTAEPAPGSDPCAAPDGAADGCGGTTGGEPTTTIPLCKVQPDGSEICETVPGVSCPQVVPPADEPLGAPETVECTPPPPTEPVPLPEPAGPVEVVLVDAAPVLVLLAAIDGSADAYLVPGYRFTTEDGSQVDLPAVADESLTSPVTTDTTVPPDTGGLPDPGGKPPVEPQPCGPPLVEEDASGSTHTVQPNPDCVDPEPERIDLILHCVVIADWQGLWWTTEAINQPDGWVGTGTITLEADGTATYVDDGTPDDPATFTAQGPAEEYPGCD